jgi:hypothetical protein
MIIIIYTLLFVNVLSALDIYRDSKTRKYGLLYPLLGLFLGIPGMVIYNLLFGGRVFLAVRLKYETGKPGPFARLGATFIVLGSLFVLGALAVMLGGGGDISTTFLLLAGVCTAALGGFFTAYDKKKQQNAV